jgi:hypothetical protein
MLLRAVTLPKNGLPPRVIGDGTAGYLNLAGEDRPPLAAGDRDVR